MYSQRCFFRGSLTIIKFVTIKVGSHASGDEGRGLCNCEQLPPPFPRLSIRMPRVPRPVMHRVHIARQCPKRDRRAFTETPILVSRGTSALTGTRSPDLPTE